MISIKKDLSLNEYIMEEKHNTCCSKTTIISIIVFNIAGFVILVLVLSMCIIPNKKLCF